MSLITTTKTMVLKKYSQHACRKSVSCKAPVLSLKTSGTVTMEDSGWETDGSIVKCKYSSCHEYLPNLKAELEITGIETRSFVLSRHLTDLELLSSIKGQKFILVLICSHINSHPDLQKHLKVFENKVVVIANEKPEKQYADYIYCESRNISGIIKITKDLIELPNPDNNIYIPPLVPPRHQRLSDSEDSTVPKKIYVPGTSALSHREQKLSESENRATTPPDSPAPVLPKRKKNIAEADSPSSVSRKTLHNTTKNDLKKPERATSQTVEIPNGFINTDTFECFDNNNRGVYVLQSSCSPKVLVQTNVKEIKRRFNGESDDIRDELSKQILSDTIPSLVKNGSLLDLVDLLDIDDDRIQGSVFSALDSLQLHTSLSSRCIKGYDNLKSVKHLLELCNKWCSNHHVMLQLLPVTLDAIAILHLSCTGRTHQSNLAQEAQTLAEQFHPLVLSRTNGTMDTLIKDMFVFLENILDCMRMLGKKPTSLQFGSFRDVLLNEENRNRLKTDFTKSMSLLEQYSFMLLVLNQMMHKAEAQIVNYITSLTMVLVGRVSKKPKTQSRVFTMFLLITKVVVARLSKAHSSHRGTLQYQESLCKTLNSFLDTTKVSPVSRHYILNKASTLLFHENKDVVQNTVYLFRKNNYFSKDIREKVCEHIIQQLSVINFKVDGILSDTSKVGIEPSWVTFAGRVSDERNVVMHALIPTLHCIGEGSMADYKINANKEITRRHLNSLDILKHIQEEKCHINLVELLAFQCRPLPIFYVTNQNVGQDLNAYLLDARRFCRWLSPRELVTIVADAVHALSYLHSQKVVHRNLTTFAFCMRKQNSIALHDLSISKVLGDNTKFLSDIAYNDIPVLWSAPESILEDKYDEKTDTWMLGHFIYEVFTHGCRPFTEVYGTQTEELLEYIVFQGLKPQKWPCIPKEIHDIILSCLMDKPEERIDISKIGSQLNNLLISFHGAGKRQRISQLFDDDKKYPILDATQSMPERGLPYLFLQLKKNNPQVVGVIKETYFNARRSQRLTGTIKHITEAETKSPDQPIILKKLNFVSVYEPVTVDFIQSLPHLDRNTCCEVLQLVDVPSREENNDILVEGFPYLLKYRVRQSLLLFEFAFKRPYADPENNADFYLDIVINIFKFVAEMHRRNWILRNICGENVLVLEDSKEVTLAQLGRMVRLDSCEVLDDCIIDEVPSYRKRWLPIEVLQNGQFSREGDIYMTAMVVYEFYMALNIHNANPMKNHLDCAPFAKVKRSELLKTLYSGEVPQQPDSCPPLVYEILTQCWNRDRTRRPTAENLVEQLQEIKRSISKRFPNSEASEFRKESKELLPPSCEAGDLNGFSRPPQACEPEEPEDLYDFLQDEHEIQPGYDHLHKKDPNNKANDAKYQNILSCKCEHDYSNSLSCSNPASRSDNCTSSSSGSYNIFESFSNEIGQSTSSSPYNSTDMFPSTTVNIYQNNGIIANLYDDAMSVCPFDKRTSFTSTSSSASYFTVDPGEKSSVDKHNELENESTTSLSNSAEDGATANQMQMEYAQRQEKRNKNKKSTAPNERDMDYLDPVSPYSDSIPSASSNSQYIETAEIASKPIHLKTISQQSRARKSDDTESTSENRVTSSKGLDEGISKGLKSCLKSSKTASSENKTDKRVYLELENTLCGNDDDGMNVPDDSYQDFEKSPDQRIFQKPLDEKEVFICRV